MFESHYLNTCAHIHRYDQKGVEIGYNVPIDQEDCIVKLEDDYHQDITKDQNDAEINTREKIHRCSNCCND